MSQKIKTSVEIDGSLKASQIANATTDTDKFLVSDDGTIKYRTGAEILSDLGVSLGTASKIQHQVKAGVAINKGQAVYVTSADGTNMVVGLASNASEATSSKTMGLLNATVAANGFADVVTEGLLDGLDTSTATIGNPVWLGTGGNLIYGLANKPYAPNHLVFIGIVTRVNANNGEIFVKVQNGFELDEIHDVDLKSTTPSGNDILAYEGAPVNLWKNKSIAAVLGYTPYNASNPAGYTSNVGTVTSVTGSGGYGGLTLSGSVSTSGSLTLGGTPTGIWSIGISGNAATATNADYANAAGTAQNSDTLDGIDSSRFIYGDNSTGTISISDATLNGALKSGFYTVGTGGIPNATSVNFVLHTAYNGVGNAAGFDLACNDSATSSFYLRPATGGGKGAWQTIVTSYNVSSYAVPTSRTITINGTSYDLSANRSWTVTASETDTLSTVSARGNIANYNIALGTNAAISGGGSAKWITTDGTVSYGGGLVSSLNGSAKAYYYFDGTNAVVQGAAGVGIAFQPNNTTAFTISTAGNATSTGTISASGTGGFASSTYVSAARNPIWRFGNADAYGLSYFQGTAGIGGLDTIGFHFGTATAAGSPFQFRSDGYAYASGYLEGGASLRAPIFYDSQNTGYYVDPASTSNLNGLTVSSTIAGSVNGASRYFPTNYVGGVQTNPQVYFNYLQGLNVAMTGAWSTWSDTLWINGYSGGDVPNMCALHFLRNGQPRMSISTQTRESTSYGTYYEILTDYNYSSRSSFSGAVYGSIYYDSNDTGYYVDPASTSNLKFLQVGRPSNGQSGTRLLGGQGTSYGAITLDVDISNYGTGIKINNQSSTYANSAMAFFWNGSQCGGVSIGVNSTAYNTSSDYRLKENVVPIESPIVRLKELNPCRFNFINEPSKTVDGFIAHEVQEIIPEAVTGTKDELDYDGTPKHQGIDQSKIVPLLTAALQEAIEKIEELENRLSILENK